MELLGVIDLQNHENPKCIKHIKQNQLCYAEKSATHSPDAMDPIRVWYMNVKGTSRGLTG